MKVITRQERKSDRVRALVCWSCRSVEDCLSHSWSTATMLVYSITKHSFTLLCTSIQHISLHANTHTWSHNKRAGSKVTVEGLVTDQTWPIFPHYHTMPLHISFEVDRPHSMCVWVCVCNCVCVVCPSDRSLTSQLTSPGRKTGCTHAHTNHHTHSHTHIQKPFPADFSML